MLFYSSRDGHWRPANRTSGSALCVLIQANQTHPRDITGCRDQGHHLSKLTTSQPCLLPATLPSPIIVKAKSESHTEEKENALSPLIPPLEYSPGFLSYRKEVMLASSGGCGLRRNQTQKREQARMLPRVQLSFHGPV